MNWKQKLSLWIGGILISMLLIINAIDKAWSPTRGYYKFDYTDFIIPVLIITGLLFITFRK